MTAVSALLTVDPDAPAWLLALALAQRGKLAKEARGRIVAGITSTPRSPAAAAWLRTLVWTDGYDVCRTEAVRGLATQGALDEETIRFALEPSFTRLPHNAKRPDWGVRGQVVAAVIRARAAASPLGMKLFSLAVQHLTRPDAPPSVIGSGLSPLDTLPLPEPPRGSWVRSR